MIPNPHQQAHELIACGTHDLSDSQQAWLRTHLNECRSCRDYAQAAEQFVRSLRSVPVVADLALVRLSRLSVAPVSAAHWAALCELGQVKLGKGAIK